MVGYDLYHWYGRILGPLGSCYYGGTFFVDIVIPDDYPNDPPFVRFVTKMWHPNIDSETGLIRLDILARRWKP